MTQVHRLPKSETRDILQGLGYLETAFDGQMSQVAPVGSMASEIEQQKDGDFENDTGNCRSDVEFVQQSVLFDFENDMSSECVVQGQDILIQNDCEPCSDIEVIYDGEMFADNEPPTKKMKGDHVDLSGLEEIEINPAMLAAAENHLAEFDGKCTPF